MRCIAFWIPVILSVPAMAQVFRFEEPKGIAMFSSEKHVPSPDTFTGVKPVVIIGEKEMTIVWGDSKVAGGAEKAWKAIIINRNVDSVSAIAIDSGELGSAVMLYTIDLKRGFLYMSTHKEGSLTNRSSVSSYVAKNEKLP